MEGDVKSHIGNKGEWGMGVSICNSENVIVKDINISNCWGDCIYVGQSVNTKDNYSSDVTIENVTCDAGRRQGVSIIAGKNVILKNCKILNTGAMKSTPPSAGIDIEPNIEDAFLDNIIIKNCTFIGNNKNCDLMFYNLNPQTKMSIENCVFPSGIKLLKDVWGLTFINCRINELIDKEDSRDKQQWVNCEIDKFSKD